MTINRTTLLDLPLPVTGTESGTWGDVTNNGLTQYLDIAIAGRTALTSSDFIAGALTISTTEGDSSATNIVAGSAQYATLYVSSLAANSTITAPSSNRAYRVFNADSTYTLTVKASGQTGVTFPVGTSGTVVFNGTDYVLLGTFFNTATVISVTDNTNAALRITQTGSGNALLVEDSANPDSSPIVIDSGGNLVIGNTTASSGAVSGVLQVQGAGANGSSANFQAYSASTGGTLEFDRSRGSLGTQTVVQSGDRLGRIFFCGSDGASFIRGAEIYTDVDGTPGTNDMPGRLIFSTTADGASSPTERTRISANGTLQHRNDLVANNVTVLTASYDSVSFSVAGQETVPTSIAFSTDGTRMYILGVTGNDITQYTLTTAWNITTAGSPTTFSVSGQDTVPTGLYFRPNGLQFYVVGQANDTVYEYACSTAWSIATASYSSKSFSVSSQETSPTGIFFKPDGKKMYVVGSSSDAIYEYDLGTAWDVSTSVYNSVSLSVSGQESQPNDLFFTNDGYKLFVTGQTGDDVNEYILSRSWDITTASFLGVFSVASQDTVPQGITFKPDLSKFYVVGSTNDSVFQYSTGDSNIDLTAKTIDINGTTNVIGPINFQDPAVFAVNNTERMRIDSSGNVLVGGTAARATTLGAAHLDLFNGTAPAGTLTNGVSLYSSSGDFNFMDAAGNGYKVGFRNIPPVGTKTGSYTLATSDVGEYVQVGSGGSITIPNATFAEGDVVSIFNNTSGNITITCTITTAYIAGTDSDKASVTLATRGIASVLFISGTVCVITGNVS
jgi:sugar lactone lactonase YvrE